MTAVPQPGWYPDPAGDAERYRWWDGQGWIEAMSESAQAPAPHGRPADEPAFSHPPRRASSWRGMAALTVGIAVFLSASVGIGLVIWDDPATRTADLPTGVRGVGSRPTALHTAPTGQLDQASRTATIGSASLVLPDAPYVLYPDPMPLPGVLDVVFSSGATVHQRYDGRHDWSAAVLFGQVTRSVVGGDLESEGRLTMHRLGQTFFDHQATEVKGVSWSDHSVDQNPGLLFSATIGYSVANLPSRHDRVTALLVRLDDGSLIIAAAAVPNDADPEVARQAAESLQTLTIR